MAGKAKVTEMREIFVPRAAAREQQTMLVSVNGKNWFLPRGQKSLVPEQVAEEFERSMEAQELFDRCCCDLRQAGSGR